MRRKLTIAAGIIHDPKVLFIDEMTTGIDVESARHIRNLILELKNKGTTIFLTTHYIEEAQRLCNRVAFIVEGRIIRTGTVEELMENAGNEHIIKLILDKNVRALETELQQEFPLLGIAAQDTDTCIITSPERVNLLAILQYFNRKDITVYEAKEMHPSLEDVFVKVTGIEAEKLRKEKEGVRQ